MNTAFWPFRLYRCHVIALRIGLQTSAAAPTLALFRIFCMLCRSKLTLKYSVNIRHRYTVCIYVMSPYTVCIYVMSPYTVCIYVMSPYTVCIYVMSPYTVCIYVMSPYTVYLRDVSIHSVYLRDVSIHSLYVRDVSIHSFTCLAPISYHLHSGRSRYISRFRLEQDSNKGRSSYLTERRT